MAGEFIPPAVRPGPLARTRAWRNANERKKLTLCDRHPDAFECKLRVRSEAMARLLMQDGGPNN